MTRRNFNYYCAQVGTGGLVANHLGLPYPEALAPKRITKTDTHVHLFNLKDFSYPWLENNPEIRRNFSISDFRTASRRSNVDKIVFMESGARPEESLAEIDWVLEEAKLDERLRGIVARGDVNQDGDIVPGIEHLTATKLVKGIRGRLNQELIQSKAFVRGMKILAGHQLSMDLLLRPSLLSPAAKAIRHCPDTVFILDHLGYPDIKTGEVDLWKRGIVEIAQCPNVNCKISGIINVASENWTAKSLKPYVHFAIEQFGFDRIVYGGDWPNSLRASNNYRDWARAFEKITAGFSKMELKQLYHQNADRIYRLV